MQPLNHHGTYLRIHVLKRSDKNFEIVVPANLGIWLVRRHLGIAFFASKLLTTFVFPVSKQDITIRKRTSFQNAIQI